MNVGMLLAARGRQCSLESSIRPVPVAWTGGPSRPWQGADAPRQARRLPNGPQVAAGAVSETLQNQLRNDLLWIPKGYCIFGNARAWK